MPITQTLDKNITFTSLHKNLQLHQKEVSSIGIKVFQNLSQCTKNISDSSKQFKSTVKDYLDTQSF